MALWYSRFRCTAASILRSCSTLMGGGLPSLPDKSTSVSISLASMACTKTSPACAVMLFLESINTRRDLFTCKASANLIIPFWSPPPFVRLLLSRFSIRREVFFFRASPMASAALTPKLFASHSSFCRCMFFSSMPASETPSSSLSPFLFRSSDMQEKFFSMACVNSLKRTELSSMPQTVMCGGLVFSPSACRIWSRPPSIFLRCSSSSRRLRSCSFRSCSWICFCFFACCSFCLRAASSCSFCFLRFSWACFLRSSSSILRFCSSSVRLVLGRTSTGGLKVRLPRTSISLSSNARRSSWVGGAAGGIFTAEGWRQGRPPSPRRRQWRNGHTAAEGWLKPCLP
mmetsp:Transcript_42409/g.132224  ORF Transcript_42409/g.132224 Transcript_42409/m.132224 type:complete len:343 (-) Transcript_42409:7-1035(-)